MKRYMEILGYRVQDLVTKFNGTVTTVGFDLYGCVQCLVTQDAKEGKYSESVWFDHKRLLVTGFEPVMPVPTFEDAAMKVEPGPESKPPMSRNPLP